MKNQTEFGYIFDGYCETGLSMFDTLPILMTKGEIYSNGEMWKVEELLTREEAGSLVDLEDYEDVETWVYCVPTGQNFQEWWREMKLNKLGID